MPVDDAAAAATATTVDVATAADDDDDDVCFISLRQRCDVAVADLTLLIGFTLFVALVVVVNTRPHFRVSLFLFYLLNFYFYTVFYINSSCQVLERT